MNVMRRALARVYGEHRSSERSISMLELDSYREYLKSPQWKAIRSAVLGNRPECEICGSVATQVHHHSYDPVVMAGGMNDLLLSMCRDCHLSVEFDGERKLERRDVIGKTKRLLFEAGKYSVVKRLKRGERKLMSVGDKTGDRTFKIGRSAIVSSGNRRRKTKRQMIRESIPKELRQQ